MPKDSLPVTKSQLIQECMQDLRRIVKALENYSLVVEKRFGLTGPQLWALWELGRKGPLALKDLAARMRLDPSTVVGVVDRLAVKGLVTRNPDVVDRRRISLVLTEKGLALLRSAPHPAQGHLLSGLESMERERVENLHEALHLLVSVLDAEQIKAPFFFSEG
jgi:DNA-binding MarR family transcriptional regulator